MTLTTSPTALQIIRMIPAPRERVYAVWTDPDLARQWWFSKGFVTDELVIEAWRGGRFLWALSRAGSESLVIRGKYRKVYPQEKIIHTWHCATPEWKDAMSLVTVEFNDREHNALTELRLTHENLPDEPSRDIHIDRWNTMLGRLERLLAARA